jgi:hypothetical protein
MGKRFYQGKQTIVTIPVIYHNEKVELIQMLEKLS